MGNGQEIFIVFGVSCNCESDNSVRKQDTCMKEWLLSFVAGVIGRVTSSHPANC